MRYFFILIIALSISGYSANAQDPYYVKGEILEKLFRRIADTIPDEQKIASNDSIKTYVAEYAQEESVFSHRYENLRFLGQIISPDSSLKILTWNLPLSNRRGKYFSYLIKRG
ncbi:MAG: hypothetical protein ACM3NR_01075, partial [Methanosarcina sp.]